MNATLNQIAVPLTGDTAITIRIGDVETVRKELAEFQRWVKRKPIAVLIFLTLVLTNKLVILNSRMDKLTVDTLSRNRALEVSKCWSTDKDQSEENQDVLLAQHDSSSCNCNLEVFSYLLSPVNRSEV